MAGNSNVTKMKIKKGDLVEVITGASQRNGRTKTGGIETVEAPIHISNVALVDPDTKKPTRVGHRVETVVKDGVSKTVRTRVAVRSGKDL